MTDSKLCQAYPAAGILSPAFAPPDVPEADCMLIDGQIARWTGETTQVISPIRQQSEDGSFTPVVLAKIAHPGRDEALSALAAAQRAWDLGRGKWPTASVAYRIECTETFIRLMQVERERCVRLLMWEIGKSRADSEKEFDRTVTYLRDTIEALKEVDRQGSRFTIESGFIGQIRRAPLGVVLCMGPFNYPLNETFTTLLPALMMGNTVVCKLPKLGMLSNLVFLEAFRQAFPPGVVNILPGDGATVVGPLMESGKIDALAFIGSSRVADILTKQHPLPHRCRFILGLDAKNPAVVLPDADLEATVKQCVAGALSFNGQRCTALKLFFVHRGLAERFAERMAEEVAKLKCGMPWDEGVQITPLAESGKIARMSELVADAVLKGARVMTGDLRTAGTMMRPAVLYPVTNQMRLFREEQFGPLVPIAVYDDLDEVLAAMVESPYGQQVSIFGSDPAAIGRFVDIMANQVCRVNLNVQCQRGPDTFPFTGRKDSAEGTLSVSDALRCFSIRSLVATNYDPANKELLTRIVTGRTSNFLRTDYML